MSTKPPSVRIYTNGDIVIGGESSGYTVWQSVHGTRVQNKENVILPMPEVRYTLSSISGKRKFVEDLLVAMAQYPDLRWQDNWEV